MLSCLTMLSSPRCGSGNLKDRKITQHASYLILHGSKHIVPRTKRHIGKEDKVQFIDGWLTIFFHLPQGHSTQLQMWHHISVILDTNCQNSFLEHLHYFHTWSCLLPSKYKRSFKRIPEKPKMQKPSNNINDSFLDCIIVIIVKNINVKVISITCIGFIQWCDGWFWVFFFTTFFRLYVDGIKNKSSNNKVMRERVVDIV